MKDRKTYIEKASAKLKEWDAEIQKLEAKTDMAKADAKDSYRKQISELRDMKKSVQKKLEDLQNSSNEAWEELKNGFEKSWQSLTEAFSNASEKMK